MRTIGIKLADGSFYPILEEGVPSSKTLDITTANDNQTTVLVDLYRSEDGTMEGAEYVDTLRIGVEGRQHGEKSLSFTVSLDENNHLSAHILDEESGDTSDTDITLKSRTEDERKKEKDDASAVSLLQDGKDKWPDDNTAEEEALAVAQAASGAAVESAQALDNAIRKTADDEIETIDSDVDIADSDVDMIDDATDSGIDTADDGIDVIDDGVIEENPIVVDDTDASGGMPALEDAEGNEASYSGENAREDEEEGGGGLEDEKDGRGNREDEREEGQSIESSNYDVGGEDGEGNIDFDDMVAATESFNAESDTAADDYGAAGENGGGEALDGKKEDESDKIEEDSAVSNLDDLDLPDIDGTEMAKMASGAEEDRGEGAESKIEGEGGGKSDEELPALSGMDLEMPDFGDEGDENETEEAGDFELPDFSDIGITEDKGEGVEETGDIGDLGDLDLPDFDTAFPDTANSQIDDVAGMSLDDLLNEGNEDMPDKSVSNDSNTPSGYEGNSYKNGKEERSSRSFILPVAICVSCAVVCVLALLAAVFILPRTELLKQLSGGIAMSRNSGGDEEGNAKGEGDIKGEEGDTRGEASSSESGHKEESRPSGKAIESSGTVREVSPVAQQAAEKGKKGTEETLVAEENAIVVAEVPRDKVVPALPLEKKGDIKYTVQWGDTLWDISQSYYKTPWRYKHIAQYNNIKDPDYIISGTSILIPSQ